MLHLLQAGIGILLLLPIAGWSQERSGSTASFDAARWRVVKQITAALGVGVGDARVVLLKSRKATGSDGLGNPMSDVELLILRGNSVAYDYAKQKVSAPEHYGTRFYMDDYIEVRKVTGGRNAGGPVPFRRCRGLGLDDA